MSISHQILSVSLHRERLIHEIIDILRSTPVENLETIAAIHRAPISPTYKGIAARIAKSLCDLRDEPLVRALEHEIELLAASRRQAARIPVAAPRPAFPRIVQTGSVARH